MIRTLALVLSLVSIGCGGSDDSDIDFCAGLAGKEMRLCRLDTTTLTTSSEVGLAFSTQRNSI